MDVSGSGGSKTGPTTSPNSAGASRRLNRNARRHFRIGGGSPGSLFRREPTQRWRTGSCPSTEMTISGLL
jgi:hypothetical protein